MSQQFNKDSKWRVKKGKSTINPLFNDPKVLYSASDKAKLFVKNFLQNSNLDDSGITLPIFPSRSHLKLHNISVTSKMVKNIIPNLDLSKPTGPDSIPVVVLKNCDPKLSEVFNLYLKGSCFLDYWKVSWVVPVFKNVGERSTSKNYCPVFFLWLVVFEKLVNNRLVDQLQKCGLFSDFQYGFRSSGSTADLLTVAHDRITRAFNRSESTQVVIHHCWKWWKKLKEPWQITL